jgi:hypothetical protein
MEDNKNPGNQLNIELNEVIAEGTYSNLAIVAHSGAEFVVDFIRVMPGVPKAKVVSRVILTPYHAKRLLHALQEAISKVRTLPMLLSLRVSADRLVSPEPVSKTKKLPRGAASGGTGSASLI